MIGAGGCSTLSTAVTRGCGASPCAGLLTTTIREVGGGAGISEGEGSSFSSGIGAQ